MWRPSFRKKKPKVGFSEKSYKGKIEIKGKFTEENYPPTYVDVEVKLDGKAIPGVQMVDVHFNLTKIPFVLLKIVPSELDVEIENIEITERRKDDSASD